jgi:tRNA(adenine34) deaminase
MVKNELNLASFGQLEFYMQLALKEADKAFLEGEIPVGAVVVNQSGEVISKAYNKRQSMINPLMHAEIIAISKAAKVLKSWRLSNLTLFVTLEPCLMCAGLLNQCRIKRVVYGTSDPKGGALGSLYNFSCDPRLNHEFEVIDAVLEKQCADRLRKFFRAKRNKTNL